MQNTSQSVLEGLRHQDCPFEKVVERLNPKTRSARSPLYNVSLRLQNMQVEQLDFPELKVEDMSVVMGGAQLDLMFEAIEAESGLQLNIQYDRALFRKETIEHLLVSFESILEQFSISENMPLNQIREPAKEVKETTNEQPNKLKLVICSTFTAEPLRDSLLYLAENINYPLALEFAPYNQSLQQLLDPTSLVSNNYQGINLFLIRVEDWCNGNSIEGVQDRVTEFTQMLSQSASNHSRPYIIQICPNSDNVISGLDEISKQFELELQALSVERTNVYVLTPVSYTHLTLPTKA